MSVVTNDIKSEVVSKGMGALVQNHPVIAMGLLVLMSGGGGSFLGGMFNGETTQRITILETKFDSLDRQQVKTEAVLEKLNETLSGVQATLSGLNATLSVIQKESKQ